MFFKINHGTQLFWENGFLHECTCKRIHVSCLLDDGTKYFSGLCLLYAMELSAHINDKPIGLIQASWGGTPIEAWSSPEALGTCSTNFNYG